MIMTDRMKHYVFVTSFMTLTKVWKALPQVGAIAHATTSHKAAEYPPTLGEFSKQSLDRDCQVENQIAGFPASLLTKYCNGVSVRQAPGNRALKKYFPV